MSAPNEKTDSSAPTPESVKVEKLEHAFFQPTGNSLTNGGLVNAGKSPSNAEIEAELRKRGLEVHATASDHLRHSDIGSDVATEIDLDGRISLVTFTEPQLFTDEPADEIKDEIFEKAVESLQSILRFITAQRDPRARWRRCDVVVWILRPDFLDGIKLAHLARQHGVTKAALCRLAALFRDQFGVKNRAQVSDAGREAMRKARLKSLKGGSR